MERTRSRRPCGSPRSSNCRRRAARHWPRSAGRRIGSRLCNVFPCRPSLAIVHARRCTGQARPVAPGEGVPWPSCLRALDCETVSGVRQMRRVLIMLVGGLAAAPAGAAVKSSSAGGFDVVETASVKAAPQRAYAALREVGHWWDSAHSFSHSALNMRLELRSGGCWCETLPAGGGVQHMQVVFVDPAKTVILHGTLGPLIDQGLSGA